MRKLSLTFLTFSRPHAYAASGELFSDASERPSPISNQEVSCRGLGNVSRGEAGHWEGDLIIGTVLKSCVV